jgi:hypothetical protein
MRKFVLGVLTEKAKAEGGIYVSHKPGMLTYLRIEDGYINLERLNDSPVYAHVNGVKYNSTSNEYELDLTEEGVKVWQKKEEEDRAWRAWYYNNYGKID